MYLTVDNLIDDLLDAQFASPISPGHPMDTTDLKNAQKGKSIDFIENIESYKALYYLNNLDYGHFQAKDRRKIRLDILKRVLERLGIVLSVASGHQIDIQLPNAPGMMFVISLCRFLEALRQNKLELSLSQDPSHIIVTLTIRSERLHLLHSGGPITEEYNRLLTCNQKELVKTRANRFPKEMIDKVIDKIENEWPPVPAVPAVPEKLLDVQITSTSLIIQWVSELPSTP